MTALIKYALLSAALLAFFTLARDPGAASAQPPADKSDEQVSSNAGNPAPPATGPSLEELSNQAANPNAPLTQIELRNVAAPRLPGFGGTGNGFELLAVVPIEPHQITPFPLLMRLSIPVVTLPQPVGQTGFAGVQFIAEAVLPAGSWGSWGLGFGLSTPGEKFNGVPRTPWQLGPSAAIVYSGTKNLVFGGVFLNLISITKSGPRINQLSFQPSMTYTLPGGWFFGYPDFNWIVNWENHAAVTFPVGLQVGKIVQIGKQPFSLSLEGGNNVVRPRNNDAGVPRWMIGIEITALFPAL